jgi:hypothetical protein
VISKDLQMDLMWVSSSKKIWGWKWATPFVALWELHLAKMLDEMRVLMSEVLREQVTVGQSDLLMA